MGFDIAGDDPYTASTGLLELLFHVFDNPDRGTGIYVLVARARNLLGEKLPACLAHNAVGKQVNLPGKYPVGTDIAPLILFACIFGVFVILHLIIFIINSSRGHYFLLSLIWSVNALIRMISFILRATWAQDITQVKEGIANEILFIVPSLVLVSTNLILAQRLFTWRHPVGGSRKLFWVTMVVLYFLVCIFATIAFVASAIPYLYFMSRERFLVYINLNRWIAAMVIVYTLTASILIGLSFWLPTSKDERLYTYQPWWIESFAPFYFVKKCAAQKAEETFMKRNSNHRHAIRVIAATHHHYKMVKGLSNERGDLKHNFSLLIIILSTICLFIASVLRCIVVMQARTNWDSGRASVPVAMYFSWGVFEVIVNGLLVFGRADLRFYRPDILPAAVRAIVTAEQTNVLTSAVVSEEESDTDSDDLSDDLTDDIEDGSIGYYSDPIDNDELYFGTQKTSPDMDSARTPVPQDWKSEKSYRSDDYDFNNNQKTVIHTPTNEKVREYPLDDEFKF
ncbi:hypothetical protein Cantr_04218 [Candida viswanathii]|jgi:hypothetical protein|uniref:Uncharacterized protein n=1 Tax=Candida viswanathii TaxID=5486 RepID=A0A367XLL7_9ASCO|nr:hypothetical protein Cantr_04218 [Candida viswanathii]